MIKENERTIVGNSTIRPEKKKLNAKSKPFVSTDAAKTAYTEFANQLHRRIEMLRLHALERLKERMKASLEELNNYVIHFRSMMAIARVNPEEAFEAWVKGGFCDNIEILQLIGKEILEKAWSNSKSCKKIAKLCAIIMGDRRSPIKKNSNQQFFKKLIIRSVQSEFDETYSSPRRLLTETQRKRALANIELIGELLLVKFIPIKVIGYCTDILLTRFFHNVLADPFSFAAQTRDFPLISLVRLYEIVGEYYERKAQISDKKEEPIYIQIAIACEKTKQRNPLHINNNSTAQVNFEMQDYFPLDELFTGLQVLLDNVEVSGDTRTMIQNLFERRKQRWKPMTDCSYCKIMYFEDNIYNNQNCDHKFCYNCFLNCVEHFSDACFFCDTPYNITRLGEFLTRQSAKEVCKEECQKLEAHQDEEVKREVPDNDDDQCVICFSNITKREILRLPCAHYFHFNCIANWIKQSTTCPICRLDLTEVE